MKILILDKKTDFYNNLLNAFDEITFIFEDDFPSNTSDVDVVFVFKKMEELPNNNNFLIFLDSNLFSGETENYYIEKNISNIISAIRLLIKYKKHCESSASLKDYYNSYLPNRSSNEIEELSENDEEIYNKKLNCYTFSHLKSQINIEIDRFFDFHSPFSLIKLNFKGYKECLEKLGEEKADEMLKDITSIIKDSVRTIDLLFHSSPDEFSLLLYNSIYFDSMIVAERLRRVLSEHKQIAADFGVFTLSDEEKWAIIIDSERVFGYISLAVENAQHTGKSHISHFSDMIINGDAKNPTDI